jgi:hypothetical protein
MPFTKHFIVASMYQTFPIYLTVGRAALFDNFHITGVDFHFSISPAGAMRFDSEVEAAVWVGGLLHLYSRFAPLTIMSVYDPEILLPPDNLDNPAK